MQPVFAHDAVCHCVCYPHTCLAHCFAKRWFWQSMTSLVPKQMPCMHAGNVVAVALNMEITVVRSGKTPDYTAAHQRAVERLHMVYTANQSW